MKNLAAKTLYDYIVGDFESTWNALAAVHGNRPRGNFMFARQAMTLLEFAGRLCKADSSGCAVKDLSRELNALEKRYFSVLPSKCVNKPSEYELPSIGSNPENQLLWAMFDLIRHGQAHQYQQIMVNLVGGDFAIELTGAIYGQGLIDLAVAGRSAGHLSYRRDSADLWLHVNTGWLFLDIKTAIEKSGILLRGVVPKPLVRGGSGGTYHFSVANLEESLIKAGHKTL